MTDPTKGIGSILKQVRLEKGMTLDETASLTGVSKAMLGQIERGKSNPTISTLWKVATGLKISFSELLGSEGETREIIDIIGVEPVYESDGKMILRDVFPYNPVTGFEFFYISMLPGGHHISEPHLKSTEEHIVVTSGRLRLSVGSQVYELLAPSAIRFNSNKVHSYSNPYDEEVVFQSIIKY